MALDRLAAVAYQWNMPGEDGVSIEPPLSFEEVVAFDTYSIDPAVEVLFSHDQQMTGKRKQRMSAKMALIACKHIRTPNKPELAAKVLLEARMEAVAE